MRIIKYKLEIVCVSQIFRIKDKFLDLSIFIFVFKNYFYVFFFFLVALFLGTIFLAILLAPEITELN